LYGGKGGEKSKNDYPEEDSLKYKGLCVVLFAITKTSACESI